MNHADAFEGHHDRADCTIISGWAWDMNRPDTPIHVDIYDGSTLLATVKAGEFRRDLFEAGKGNGKHAFTFAVPSCLKDGEPHLIGVKVRGADFELVATPKEINCKQEITERCSLGGQKGFLRSIRQAVQRFRNRSVPRALILGYHSISEVQPDPWGLCVTPGHFAEHLEILHKHYHTMHLSQFNEALDTGKFPRQTIVITFDDGYADNLSNAKPLLERYNIPATFFLTTGHIGSGREFWWDELERALMLPGTLPEVLCIKVNGNTFQWELGECVCFSEEDRLHHRSWKVGENDNQNSRYALYEALDQLLRPLPHEDQQKVLDEILLWAGEKTACRPTHRCLSSEEVVALAEGDLIEIGSHTVTHPHFPTLPVSLQRDEIMQSKASLEELLGSPVKGFAYPYCLYTAETVSLVKEAGYAYACACATTPCIIYRKADHFELPRMLAEDWDGEVFAKKLSDWFKA
jgi:peptidoglycan/xylan/chitin deacetylase (PgdA/CDA1 family)